MVENPGMWVRARSLFQVGTVVGLLRMWLMVRPEVAQCRGKHRPGEAWISVSIIGRWL